MLEASQPLAPPSTLPLQIWLTSFRAVSASSGPRVPSSAIKWPLGLEAKLDLGGLELPRQPLDHGVHVPFRPGAALALPEKLPDGTVLLIDGLLGVNGHELEDQGQGLVLLVHPRYVLFIAFHRIVDVGDILARLVKPGRPVDSEALARDFRRNGEVKYRIRPEQWDVDVQLPVEAEA